MTSGHSAKADRLLQPSVDRGRRCLLDQLPPTANSSKPLTPFSIEDILNKPTIKRSLASLCPSRAVQKAAVLKGANNGINSPSSPLCALEELASKTFRGLEVSVIQAAEGREHVNTFDQKHPSKKLRKSRTAFTNHQIYELEKRFLYQKYLSPVDRDQIAQQLHLTNAQVITWFQNRRAKLKRDLEEMKADVESLKKMPPQNLQKLVTMADIDEPRGSSEDISPCSFAISRDHGVLLRPSLLCRTQAMEEFSEDDDEIAVDE